MTQADTERLEAFKMWVLMDKNSLVECWSSSESARDEEYLKHSTTAKTQIGQIMTHESLLCDIIEGRMLEMQQEEEIGYKC